MGFYEAGRETMDKLRKAIMERPEEFQKAIASCLTQGKFVLEGDTYRRMPVTGVAAEFQDWYLRKNLYLVCNRRLTAPVVDDLIASMELLDDLSAGFELLAPLYRYLWRLREGG